MRWCNVCSLACISHGYAICSTKYDNLTHFLLNIPYGQYANHMFYLNTYDKHLMPDIKKKSGNAIVYAIICNYFRDTIFFYTVW